MAENSILNAVNTLIIDEINPVLTINWTISVPNVTHRIEIKHGAITILTLSNLTGSLGQTNKTYTLTSSQRSAILNYMVFSSSLTATFVLTTCKGSSQIGSTSSVTAKITTTVSDSSPSFSGFNYADVNSSTVAMTNDNQILIKNYSQLTINCNTAIPQKGAHIVKYVAKIGDKEVESTNTSIDFGEVTVNGNIAIIVTVYDSRQYVKTVSQLVTVVNYSPISFTSWSIRRINNTDTVTQLNFEGIMSPVKINNETKNHINNIQYRYKKTTETTWNLWTPITGFNETGSSFSYENTQFVSLESSNSYNMQIKVSDLLTSHTINLSINKGIPLMSYRSGKIGINNPNPSSAFDINGGLIVDGISLSPKIYKLSVTGGWAASSSLLGVQLYVLGKLGILIGRIQSPTETNLTPGNNPICTLPDGIRPIKTMETTITVNVSGNVPDTHIIQLGATDGTLVPYTSTYRSKNVYSFSLIFLIA